MQAILNIIKNIISLLSVVAQNGKIKWINNYFLVWWLKGFFGRLKLNNLLLVQICSWEY